MTDEHGFPRLDQGLGEDLAGQWLRALQAQQAHWLRVLRGPSPEAIAPGRLTPTPTPAVLSRGAHRPPFKDVAAKELDVELELLPVLSYALQHVGIGVVQSITVHNRGREPSQNLVVEVALSPAKYGEAWVHNLAELPGGRTWTQQNLRLPLSLDRLRAATEKEQAWLRVTVKDRNEVLYARTEPVSVLAFNEWLHLPKALHILAAYVQPNDAALAPVLAAAAGRLGEDGRGPLPGYQPRSAEAVLAMLEAGHDAVTHDFELGYINPPASFETSGQKIRLVGECLAQGRGTCLDLAVLQAALWEQMGLHPCVVLIPGHALLACWTRETDSGQTVVQVAGRDEAAAEVRSALAHGDLVLVNSTEVTRGADGFDLAREHGQACVRATLDRGEAVNIIDIHACRRAGVTPLP